MSKPSRKTFYKRLVIPFSLLFTVVVFDRMDQEFVVPGQLKKIIDILDVQTEKEDDWWRARIKMRHRGFNEVNVSLDLTWLDPNGNPLEKSQAIRAVAPGDTVIVRLSVKATGGKQAADHHLDYSVSLTP